jgi:hypothetical protein
MLQKAQRPSELIKPRARAILVHRGPIDGSLKKRIFLRGKFLT